MKKLLLALACALPMLAVAQEQVPYPATQAQVDAGTDPYPYVSPLTLANSSLIAGLSLSNVTETASQVNVGTNLVVASGATISGDGAALSIDNSGYTGNLPSDATGDTIGELLALIDAFDLGGGSGSTNWIDVSDGEVKLDKGGSTSITFSNNADGQLTIYGSQIILTNPAAADSYVQLWATGGDFIAPGDAIVQGLQLEEASPNGDTFRLSIGTAYGGTSRNWTLLTGDKDGTLDVSTTTATGVVLFDDSALDGANITASTVTSNAFDADTTDDYVANVIAATTPSTTNGHGNPAAGFVLDSQVFGNGLTNFGGQMSWDVPAATSADTNWVFDLTAPTAKNATLLTETNVNLTLTNWSKGFEWSVTIIATNTPVWLSIPTNNLVWMNTNGWTFDGAVSFTNLLAEDKTLMLAVEVDGIGRIVAAQKTSEWP